MIKTLNPSSSSKTDEIMSRYRPIAPKPADGATIAAADGALGSPKMSHNPYLRAVWSNLQARPTRARKRGRGRISSMAIKRRRPSSSSSSFSMQGFAHCGLPLTAGGAVVAEKPETAASSNGTKQPLFMCPMPSPTVTQIPPLAEVNPGGGLEEKDLRLQLKLPSTTSVISPQPIRPIGSSIRVGFINKEKLHAELPKEMRRPEEVEEAMEAEKLPAIITDSNNKVRLANSAYKEMVGQPECTWLDSMMGKTGRSETRRSTISGEVVIQDLSETGLPVSAGFSCWVRIEWERKGEKRWIDAFSEVRRLCCDSKDYLFTWRFHVQEREEVELGLATFI